MNSSNNTEFALRALPLVLQGIPVFPCKPDKTPHTEHGFHDATTDIKQVSDWSMIYPQALVGVPTGPASGIDVIDVDIKADGGGTVIANGFESLALLPALPPTVIHKTTRGEHRLYRTNCRKLRCTSGQIAPGVDTRGEGGYIIWWPAEGKERVGDVLADLPEWVKDTLEPKDDRKQSSTRETPANLSEVASALAACDPDCDRQTWIELGMAVHDADSGEQGFDIWNSWSAQSPGKYPGEREVGKQWASFKSKADGITVATLFKHAGDAGWTPPPPDVTGLFKAVSSDRAEQREQSRRIGEGFDFDPMPELLSVQDMINRFVFLADGSRVFDRCFPAHVLGFSDWRNMTAKNIDHVPTGEFQRDGTPKCKTVARADTWLRSENRMSAVSTTFRPGEGLFVADPNGRHCANLWNGYRQGTLAEMWAVDQLFVQHVRWLFADRADEFLDWLAHIQQRPGVLPHTAWLHVSSHTGTGRNWLASLLARVWAGHVATALDLEHTLESGFNERLSRKVLAIVDEIRVGGQHWNQAEALKQLITAEVRSINVKYGRLSMEFNACRFLLFSNHRSAIPLDDTDRRFEVVTNDDKPMPVDYYESLYAALHDPTFVAGVAWWLSKRDISAFRPGRHATMNAAKKQVIQMSTPEHVANLREFSDNYPGQLVSAETLVRFANISTFGKSAIAFTRAAEECGWISIKRKRLKNGNRKVLYARKEVAVMWADAVFGFEKQLPEVDGGEIKWSL